MPSEQTTNSGIPPENNGDSGIPPNNDGDSNSHTTTQLNAVNRIQVRVPPFWKQNPQLWFGQLEAQFANSNITSDLTKFNTIVGVVESDYVFAKAVNELFAGNLTDIQFKVVRLGNNDLQEILFEREERTLRFAIVNGFRNIQNIVQKLKRKKNPYDYVEIMACPSGCINGSAQIKPSNGVTSKELIEKVQNLYYSLPKCSNEDCDKISEKISDDWLSNNSDKSKSMLHTSYHAVPKNTMSLNIKW